MFIHFGVDGLPAQAVPHSDTRDVPAFMSPGLLEARSGLARHTVLRGISQLESADWLSARPNGFHTAPERSTPERRASVPVDLLLDRQVSVRDKLLYGTLQLTPGFRREAGQFTYLELSALAGVSLNTVKQAVRALQAAGWLQVSQRNQFSPIHFSLRNPAAERRGNAAARVSRRLEEASFVGEALMREYLSLLVSSDEFDDDASPGFLVNPYTGEELQFDRYYPPGVAFEFNGPQHYGPTARYSSEAEAKKQQARDYIKLGICVTRGIKLVVVQPKDLTLEVMRQKVGDLLPLRSLDCHEPAVAYLERVSRAYRKQARKREASAQPAT